MGKNEKLLLRKVRKTAREQKAIADGAYKLRASEMSHMPERSQANKLFLGSLLWMINLNPKDYEDKLLRKAFTYCDLDPAKPMHWRVLLNALVEVCFRESGAPRKWDKYGLFKLYCEVLSIQDREPSLSSNAEIARRLRSSRFHGKYDDIGEAALAKLIAKARNPRFNPGVGFRENPHDVVPLLRLAAEEHGSEWTPEMEKRFLLVEDKFFQILEDMRLAEE